MKCFKQWTQSRYLISIIIICNGSILIHLYVCSQSLKKSAIHFNTSVSPLLCQTSYLIDVVLRASVQTLNTYFFNFWVFILFFIFCSGDDTITQKNILCQASFQLYNDKKIFVQPKFVKMPPSHFIGSDEIFAKLFYFKSVISQPDKTILKKQV